MRTPDWEGQRGRYRSSSHPRAGATTRMKRLFCTAIPLLVACSLALGADEDQEEETLNAKPDAGGILIDPSRGKIAQGDQITIVFPLTMVAPDLIDVGNQPCPFVSEPELEGTFLWKSRTEGV